MSLCPWSFLSFLVVCSRIGTVLSGLAYPDYAFDPCPTGASYNSDTDKCFVVRHKLVSRNIAERNCENMGGILAIIDDEMEQQFIISITQLYIYWIGPNDQEKSRVYVNPDGTLPSYFNWDSQGNGQPNDNVNLNDPACVSLIDTDAKTWHDDECDNPERYVCQLLQPSNFLQLTCIYLTASKFTDGEWWTTNTAKSRIKCQILCVSHPVCIGYLWNTGVKTNNCRLIRPFIGGVLYAHTGEMIYEVVER